MSENKCKWKEKKCQSFSFTGVPSFLCSTRSFISKIGIPFTCRRLQASSVAGASVTFSHTSGIVTSHKCQSYMYIASLMFSVGYELRTKKMQAIHTWKVSMKSISQFPRKHFQWIVNLILRHKKFLCVKRNVERHFLIFCWPCISIYLFININQLDALNFIISLFQVSTCFEHMCLSSGGQNCIIRSLVSSYL